MIALPIFLGVFLDEPTSALDPEAAHLVREFIGELKREGRTMFLCTHNLDEADRLCDRIAVFNTRLLVLDTPANLRQQLYGPQVVFHLREVTQPHADAGRKVLRKQRVKTKSSPSVFGFGITMSKYARRPSTCLRLS